MAINFEGDVKRGSEYNIFPEDIVIKPELNGRHDKPDIEWLINDILQHGQHTLVSIRSDGGKPTLVAGFSRWRAVSEINRRKMLGETKLRLRCSGVVCKEEDAFILNISENRFRNPVSALDDAYNIKRLLTVYGKDESEVATIYFPTAKTDDEIKMARKFVQNRISLISLTKEGENALRSGRMNETAAVAISKLSAEQQRNIVKVDGPIDSRSIKTKKKPAKKAATPDSELLRRVNVVCEDLDGIIHKADKAYIEVERVAMLDLYNYAKMLRKK